MKPLLAATATGATDEQLVAAAREGSDEAFEALFCRYRDRVVGYVRGMVSDHGRAEDIVQEAFLSALRSLRRTDQDIAFRPWIYEIAKNACIDHVRRARRTQEVSIDSDDFGPVEESRLSQSGTGTDAAVARRHELESLRMAFHDLPSSQHQILVMRELEGLSYDNIGNRMGLTRGAVESLLFRARRRLRAGYDEIDTGARCAGMRDAMEALAHGTARARDRRRLSSHLHDCKPCRRTAVAMGLDSLVLAAQRDRARSALHRAAAMLPLPAFLRRRIDDAGPALGPAAQAGVEHGSTLAAKATAVVAAAVLAAGGAGVTHKATGGDLPLVGGSDPSAAGAGTGDGDPGQAGGEAGPSGGPGAAGQGFSGSGAGVPAGAGLVPGAPGASLPGAVPGAKGGLPLPTAGNGPAGPGGALGESGRAGELLPGAGDLPSKTIDNLAKGDVGGVVNDLGETVKQTPGKVKKLVKKAPKAEAQPPKVKVKPQKIKVKPPKAKVTLPGGGSVQTAPGAGTPVVTPPPTQLPNTGTTGLQVPLVGDALSRTGLGL